MKVFQIETGRCEEMAAVYVTWFFSDAPRQAYCLILDDCALVKCSHNPGALVSCRAELLVRDGTAVGEKRWAAWTQAVRELTDYPFRRKR